MIQGAASELTAIADLANQGRRVFVEDGGRRVSWRCFGAGRPLVLIHGGHGSWLHWFRNIEALAADFSVFVPDLPGYGDSDRPPPNGGLRSMSGPVVRTLNHLIGVDTRFDLVGFSFGGLVAADVAAERPEIGRIALLGPAGLTGPRRPRGTLHAWKVAAQSGDAYFLEQAMRHNLAMHMLHAPAADIDSLAVWIHTDACLRTRFRSKEISRGGGLQSALEKTQVPTMAVWGEHDVTAVPEQMGASLPSCSTQIVKGAGHWVQYERPDEINRLLKAWLNANLEK